MSGNASPAWRRNHETQPTGCWQIGAWGAGGPGQPPVCTPGLQTDPTVSRWPGEHPPPHPSHLSTLCPELTNVPPVVGVPSTLVVGKAQLHLNTVGRTQSRAWSQWDSHVLLLTLVLGKGDSGPLWGDSQEQNWGVYKAVVTSPFLEVASGETEAQGTGLICLSY